MTHDGTRSGDRGGDSALIRGVRVTPAWRAEFLSGRIVAMVGSSLRESCVGRSMNASMLGPILARWELWRAPFFGLVGARAGTNDLRAMKSIALVATALLVMFGHRGRVCCRSTWPARSTTARARRKLIK